MKHVTSDELVDRIYGIESAEVMVHLSDCADCSARFETMQERRSIVVEPTPVALDVLAAQRRAIYSRMGEQPRSRMMWAPALVAASLMAVGVFVYRPMMSPQIAAPQHVTHTETSSDAELLAEVYSMQQSLEPRAAAPIHALFEDEQ
jgi:hypothetical protein